MTFLYTSATTTPYVTFLSMILLEIFEYFEYYCEIHIVCTVALCFFVYIKVTFICMDVSCYTFGRFYIFGYIFDIAMS